MAALWTVLWRASQSVAAHARLHIHSLGLGPSDFAVLEALYHKGPLPVQVLGGKVLLTSGSITPAVDRLEERGLVERRADREDRRVRLVRLTPVGRRFMRRVWPEHVRALEEALTGVPPGARRALHEQLRRLGLAAEESLERK